MLTTLIETAALMDPARPVLQHEGRPISIGELEGRAKRLAGLLRDAGAEHCVFIGDNSPAVPLALFASIFAGVPFTPLNYRLSAQMLDALLDRISNPLLIAEGPVGAVDATYTPAQWWEEGRGPVPDPPLDDVAGEAVATILFTSGTTSAPKAVPLRHANLTAYLLNTIELMGADASEAALMSVPPYHVAAIGATLTNLLSGRRVVYLPDFSPSRWLDAVDAERVTSAMVVPTMLARLTDHLNGVPLTGGTLRSLAYGGAHTTPDLLAKALATFPEVDFTHAYGLTETASTIAVLSPDDHREALADDAPPHWRARLGSVGRPIPGVEFLIRNDHGMPVPAGEPGALFVRGEQVSGEYVGQQAGLDDDGWFETRDSAWLDDDGYLYVVGRVDDTIIRGAENIAPAEVEDALTEHPHVQDAAVFGVPDAEWGERVVAAVVTEAGAQTGVAELRGWVKERLRSSRTPDDVMFMAELPYGPTGKLLRRTVAQTYAQAQKSALEGDDT